MKKSIYGKDLNLHGDITITLKADERMMICEALAQAAPYEIDILPILRLANRLVAVEGDE